MREKTECEGDAGLYRRLNPVRNSIGVLIPAGVINEAIIEKT